eukprot:scaffold20942_cov113-Isochrysis_galbana.AAC.5
MAPVGLASRGTSLGQRWLWMTTWTPQLPPDSLSCRLHTFPTCAMRVLLPSAACRVFEVLIKCTLCIGARRGDLGSEDPDPGTRPSIHVMSRASGLTTRVVVPGSVERGGAPGHGHGHSAKPHLGYLRYK